MMDAKSHSINPFGSEKDRFKFCHNEDRTVEHAHRLLTKKEVIARPYNTFLYSNPHSGNCRT